jgi:translation elongation factor EF-Ts
VAVEVSCETDFVAKAESVKSLLDTALASAVKDDQTEGDLVEKVRNNVKEELENARRITGERIDIRQAVKVQGETIGSYV